MVSVDIDSSSNFLLFITATELMDPFTFYIEATTNVDDYIYHEVKVTIFDATFP